MGVNRFFTTIRLPLLLEAISVLLCMLLPSIVPAGSLLVVKVLTIFWGGWLIAKEQGGSHVHAIWVGPVILLEIAFLMGGYGAVFGDFPGAKEVLKDPWEVAHPGLMLFGGAIVAALMFSPVAMFVAFIGSWASRRHSIASDGKVDP